MEELKKAPVTAILMFLNIAVFLLVEITGGSQNTMHMLACGAAYTPYVIEEGEWYRLFVCMFLHFGMEHLVNNMLLLFVLGGRVERTVGKVRFLLLYLMGGVTGNIISLILDVQKQESAVSAGASGAVFAVMGAMLYLILRFRGRLEDLSGRQIFLMAALSLYFGFASSGVDNAAHVGGLIGGFLLAAVLCIGMPLQRPTPAEENVSARDPM